MNSAEAVRLEVLRRYAVLDTAPEPRFDRLASLAGRIFDAPIAVLTFAEGGRNWFKARHGLSVTELPRRSSPPGVDAVRVVPDLRADPELADLFAGSGAPRPGFYAHAPLVSPEGQAFGHLCVLDTRPRQDFGARQAGMLADLADTAVDLLETRPARRASPRSPLHRDLAAAIERDQLALAYQPLLDLRSGRIVAFEALLRWRHPRRGAVPPSVFVPLAERTGLIDRLGDWVLRRACRDAACWPGEVGVSVNISPAQIRAATLPDRIDRALDEAGLPAARLELEVTESLPLPDTAATRDMLRALRGAGVRVAVDDFGSGHASLDSLRAFAFDKIKIDRAFVDGVASEECAAIVRAVTALARDLGAVTTAEGVERAAQLAPLLEAGCDQGQGYLFSRPVPDAAVPALLAELR